MTPTLKISSKAALPWQKIAWFGVLALVCYAPIIRSLVGDWITDADMGHGFFVPVIAGFIIWQRREELFQTEIRPDWWGLVPVLWGMAQLMVGTLGVELFLSRTALIITLFGMVWLLCGLEILKKVFFPLALLCFMVPIPAIIYNRITFPLQLLASKLAADSLTLLGMPVLREGNILELPNRTLSVVEACSGIRSLLSLTFLSLVYGYFFEKRTWLRVVLLLATIPIAIIANGARVTITGIITQFKPEYAEGFFHESTGWVIFMTALVILLLFHQLLLRAARISAARFKS
jgi:exosortase